MLGALWRTARDESGGVTAFALLLFVLMLMTAGLAIDVNHAVQARNQLQGAADAAGHAALYWRYKHDEASAIQRGVDIAEANMPTSIYGDILATADVTFGDWDPGTETFTPMPGNPTAVRVTTRRTAAGENGVTTFLMKFIGHTALDLNTTSIWESEEGWCPEGRTGAFARGRIDVDTVTSFPQHTCLHSEDHIVFVEGVSLGANSSVSMPRSGNVGVPGGDISTQTGLSDALGSVNYNLNAFFNGLPKLAKDHLDPESGVHADHLTIMVAPPEIPDLITGNVTDADIVANAINYLDCETGTLTFDDDLVIRNATIVTPCAVAFRPGVALENATLVVTDQSATSVSAPNGLRLGAAGFCGDGNGAAKIVTLGGAQFPADFEAHGGMVIAGGDLTLTAGSTGLSGVSLMAGGHLAMSTAGSVGDCPFAPPEDFAIPVFKMVL